MRLKDKEVQAIISVLHSLLKKTHGELYLFGSRTDSTKKGGDIDLLLVIPEAFVEMILAEKTRLIDLIQQRIGEQRIDLTVATPEKMKTDPFLSTIVPSLVRLS